MAYATVADVNARLGSLTALGASTEPTETEAEAMLDQRSGEVDAYLAKQGVATPVTSPTSFVDWLGGVVAGGVTAMVLAIRFKADTGAEGAGWSVSYWESKWTDALKSIEDGSAVPPELADSASVVLPKTRFSDETTADGADPYFDDTRVW